ncbi:hypothetical protein AAY473_031169 [Plecturocebus cupreus]
MILAPFNLRLPSSSDSPVSASQRYGPKFLGSSHPLALASQSAGMTGMSHCAQPFF